MTERTFCVDVLGYQSPGLYSIAAKPLQRAVFIRDGNGTWASRDVIDIPLADITTTRLYKCIDFTDAETGVFVGRALSSIHNPWLYPGISGMHFDAGCLILLESEMVTVP